VEDVQKLLGWKPNPEIKRSLPTVKHTLKDLPTNWNAAQQWPACSTIGTIYNQAECGSCWAFGCVEAVSDRFCIASSGKFNQILSFQDLTSCGPCSGCEGGDAGTAWSWVQSTGLVTGTCYPYSIPTCPPQQQPCLNFVDTPPCLSSCNDTETWTAYTLTSSYNVNADVGSIQQEMFSNGPVEACFTVYDDFVNYKSGVYQAQSSNALGGHCVKCIGWGVEGGLPYWLCNNSWTTYWGDNGQFKILRGQDECGIEDDVVAGAPNVANLHQ